MNQFQVNEAVASYTSDKDFRGSPEWSGQIGPNTVNLKVGGVTITGKLGSPMTGMSAEGNGNWLTKGHERKSLLAFLPDLAADSMHQQINVHPLLGAW